MKFLRLILTFVLAFIVLIAFGQIPDTTLINDGLGEAPNVESLANIYYAIYGALVFIWGFIAKAFGLNKKVKSFVFVVIAGGLVLAGGFVYFGVLEFIPTAIALLGTLGIYDIIKGSRKAVKKSDSD